MRSGRSLQPAGGSWNEQCGSLPILIMTKIGACTVRKRKTRKRKKYYARVRCVVWT